MKGNDGDLYAILRSWSAGVGGAGAGAGAATVNRAKTNYAAKEVILNDNSFSFPISADTRNEYHEPFDKPFYWRAQAHPTTVPLPVGGLGNKLPQSLQQHQLQMLNYHNENNRVGSRQRIPPRAPRQRRKNQTTLVVRMKVETLSKDLWSWRKYGQKPIKGSPHPRNYYRCSSSKACAARKQVELSRDNPDEYIVSYIGNHTHARKFTAETTTIPSPPRWTSPTTTTYLTPTTPFDEENQQNDADSTPEKEEEEYHEDDDIILIPNTQIAEDLFMAMHGFKSKESQSPANNSLNSSGSSNKVTEQVADQSPS